MLRRAIALLLAAAASLTVAACTTTGGGNGVFVTASATPATTCDASVPVKTDGLSVKADLHNNAYVAVTACQDPSQSVWVVVPLGGGQYRYYTTEPIVQGTGTQMVRAQVGNATSVTFLRGGAQCEAALSGPTPAADGSRVLNLDKGTECFVTNVTVQVTH